MTSRWYALTTRLLYHPGLSHSHTVYYSLCFSPQRIQFAKTKSDAVAKRDGTWVPREKRKRLEEAKEAARGSKAAKPSASSDAPAVLVPKPAQKRRAMNAVPHNILFAEQLPAETTQEVLTKLFVQYVSSGCGRGSDGRIEVAMLTLHLWCCLLVMKPGTQV